MQKLILTLLLTLSFTFAGEGMEYAKKGIECKERGDSKCTISNLEKALSSNELSQKQNKSIKLFLRTTYHETIEKSMERWSLKK